MIEILLILLLIVFLTNAFGQAKFHAHGGGYATPIAVFNMLMALVCVCLLIFHTTGGKI